MRIVSIEIVTNSTEFNDYIKECSENMDIMRAECEIVARKILPVLRARVAQHLSREHGMQQHEISKKLDVTQAAVSFYLSKSRGANISLLRKFPEIDATAKKMALILKRGGKREKVKDLLCDLCKKISKKKAFKSMLK